jgi:hypothetical protein
MENRIIEQYSVENGYYDFGSRRITIGGIMEIKEAIELVKEADGYQLGLSVLKNGVLTHYIFTENFPLGDMLVSNRQVKDLIITELERAKA